MLTWIAFFVLSYYALRLAWRCCIAIAWFFLHIFNTLRRRHAYGTADPLDLSPGEYERYVACWLSENGWRSVKVVGKSGDFGADIIGTSPSGTHWAVQCKRYSGKAGVRAVQEAFAARAYYRCDRAMVVSVSGFTNAAGTLARETGVLLFVLDGNAGRRPPR